MPLYLAMFHNRRRLTCCFWMDLHSFRKITNGKNVINVVVSKTILFCSHSFMLNRKIKEVLYTHYPTPLYDWNNGKKICLFKKFWILSFVTTIPLLLIHQDKYILAIKNTVIRTSNVEQFVARANLNTVCSIGLM